MLTTLEGYHNLHRLLRVVAYFIQYVHGANIVIFVENNRGEGIRPPPDTRYIKAITNMVS